MKLACCGFGLGLPKVGLGAGLPPNDLGFTTLTFLLYSIICSLQPQETLPRVGWGEKLLVGF